MELFGRFIQHRIRRLAQLHRDDGDNPIWNRDTALGL